MTPAVAPAGDGALVAEGVGIALLPRFTTRPREVVVLRPLDGVRVDRSAVALACPDPCARRAVRAVVDQLVDVGGGLERQQED